MAFTLTGTLNGIRPVGGEIESGSRKGERWNFMSMEIIDPRYGKVYSCQMRSNDKQYKEMVNVTKVKDDRGREVEKHVLKPEYDWVDHKVKVTVTGITAGEREIEDKETGEHRTILQVRVAVTNLRDLGVPEDEE